MLSSQSSCNCPHSQVKDLYDPREQWASYILNAIKAKELFLRDVNYIVKNGEIFIVDEFTGRVMEVRATWQLRTAWLSTCGKGSTHCGKRLGDLERACDSDDSCSFR